MNEEEDVKGGASDEEINQAYKETQDPQDPRTTEKFLEERAKKNKIQGFDPSKSMLDEEFTDQKELQEDDLSAQQEFDQANKGFKVLYEVGKTADKYLGSKGSLGQLFDFIKGKSEGKDVQFPVQLLLKEQKDLPKDPTKALIPPRSQTLMVKKFFGDNITSEAIEFLKGLYGMGGPGSGPKKKAVPGPGQLGLDLSYSELNKALEQPLTEDDLTPEEKVRYAQLNADEDIDLSSFLEQQGAQTVSRKPLRVSYVEPFQAKYGASDEQVKRYVDITNRKIKDVKQTISYLNGVYKMGLPTADLEDVAADMSLLFRQDIKPQTLDAIIKGQGGKILFQTDGMKNRGQEPFEITDRESLLKVYKSRLDLLNTHGAFDKGHVYAADQLLKDNNVSSVDMYNNLEPEIRASIQQLVSPIEIEQLINGQITKGTDYIEAVIGNRSKKAVGDPSDKVFEELYGQSYGLEEDFRKFLFPDQDIANMIIPDLKPRFGRQYTAKVKEILKRYEGTKARPGFKATPGLKVGSASLTKIRRDAVKEILADYVEGKKVTKKDIEYQKSLAEIVNMFDMLLQREMVNPKTGIAYRGNEPSGGNYKLTLDEVLAEQ